jgi:hypothetical protein
MQPLEGLRAFARATPRRGREKCELCAVELGARHEHLLDPAKREIQCACAGCALAFSARAGSTWKRVPDRVERLALDLDDLDWASLGLPVEIAFFVKREGLPGQARVAALYPSPAGTVESTLPLESWRELARKNPVLDALAPEVEAVLVSHRAGAREHWRVSIDRCFRLAGLLRRSWRGFTGGARVTSEIESFFVELLEESRA